RSLIPTASATRGPRPSGRCFSRRTQAACQERPGGDAQAAWHPLILEGAAAAGQSVDQPGPGPLVSWRWQTLSNGSSGSDDRPSREVGIPPMARILKPPAPLELHDSE